MFLKEFVFSMGSWFSSEEEVVALDNNGQINNNIIIQEARDTHDQLRLSEHLVYATYFICLCEAVKIVTFLYNAHKKKIKRRYQANNI